MTNPEPHISVMPSEVIEFLNLPQGGTAFDGTLGMGGHSLLMAKALGKQGHLISCDRDLASIKQAKQRLSGLPLTFDAVQGNFKDIRVILQQLKVDAVDGILLDLGISSFQLDDPQRGFAFKSEGPLDMRMDQSQGMSAADFINTASEEEISNVIFHFGEDRFARRIAAAIVAGRRIQRITLTSQLADLVLRALPKGYQRGRIHPATRTFQALRIKVNDELGYLPNALLDCFGALKVNGRLCVISFHSLEDRIVKNTFRLLSDEDKGKILTKKPLEASEEESSRNPRSRSAKFRAIQRIA